MLLFDALAEGVDLEIGGGDAVERGDQSAEHVVEAVVFMSGFQREHVFYGFHDADS